MFSWTHAYKHIRCFNSYTQNKLYTHTQKKKKDPNQSGGQYRNYFQHLKVIRINWSLHRKHKSGECNRDFSAGDMEKNRKRAEIPPKMSEVGYGKVCKCIPMDPLDNLSSRWRETSPSKDSWAVWGGGRGATDGVEDAHRVGQSTPGTVLHWGYLEVTDSSIHNSSDFRTLWVKSKEKYIYYMLPIHS